MQLNEGISFGLFRGISAWIIGFLLVWLIVLAVKTRELTARIGLSLMIVGGAMNLHSRVVYGGVRDYWNFLGLFSNNLADWIISIGLIIYAVSSWKHIFGRRPKN